MTLMLSFTSCKSINLNEHVLVYEGSLNYPKIKEKFYKLHLYNDGKFWFYVEGHRPWQSGHGTWRDCEDYIILDFNEYGGSREKKELTERLQNIILLNCMCMMLKKKGRNKLIFYPTKTILKVIKQRIDKKV